MVCIFNGQHSSHPVPVSTVLSLQVPLWMFSNASFLLSQVKEITTFWAEFQFQFFREFFERSADAHSKTL